MESMAERGYKLFDDCDPPITLITGGPGTGKSFCIEKILGLGNLDRPIDLKIIKSYLWP